MNDNYEPIIYTLTDQEGNEKQFELLDSMDIDNQTYYALTPHCEEPEEAAAGEAGELIVLKSVYQGNEELWATVDDEEEYERIGNIFLEKLNGLLE